ncbi:MAG: sulfate transporter CysZ [Methylococcales bacterium]|nr:MAG: sulfate transporter CysZ [Methylococcales bacterium]
MKFSNKGNNPILAASYLFKGIALLGSAPLRHFILIPILINIILYSAALTLGYYYIDSLINAFIPSWLNWLHWLLWPLFFVSFLIVGFFSFTALANLVSAPFYGKLAAKTLTLINSEAIDVSEQPISKVMLAESKRLIYILRLAIPLLVLSFIPGINLIAPLLWALFSAWSMSLEYMAYPLENAGILFIEQKQLIKSIRWGALSFGGIAVLGLSIPVINIIIAPAAVIAATIYVDEMSQ